LVDHDIDMDCPPRREGTGVERFLNDVFSTKKDRELEGSDTLKKDKGFFDRLFERKN